MEDIKFLRDQYERERMEAYQQILHILDEPVIDERTKFAKRFTFALIKSAGDRKEHQIRMQAMRIQHPTSDPHVRVRPLPLPKIIPQEIQKPKIIEQPRTIQQSLTQPKKEEIILPHFAPAVPQQLPELKPEIKKEETPAPKIEAKPVEIKTPELPPLEVPAPPHNTIPIPSEVNIASHPLINAGIKTLAYARIEPHPQTQKPFYTLIEPSLSEPLYQQVLNSLNKKITKDTNILRNDHELKETIQKVYTTNNREFTIQEYENIKYYLWRDYLYTGKIDPLLHDAHISMIACQGVGKPITITFNGVTMSTNILYNSFEELDHTLKALAKLGGKEISKYNPIIDVLYHTFRIEATYNDSNSKFMIRRVTFAP